MDEEKKLDTAQRGERKKQAHTGHRKRMWDRVLSDSKHSFDSFHDHELLEMLLYSVNRQKDTNPVAHELIDTFSDIYGVFEAPLDSLKQVDGCGQQSALLIKLCREIAARCQRSAAERRKWKHITTCAEAAAYFRPKYLSVQQEVVMAVFLDNRGTVVGQVRFPPGQVNASTIDTREIVQRAVNLNAASVVLAHNHPNGDAYPSRSDISSTNQINHLLYSLKIQLFDHVIFGEGGASYSMREHCDLSPFGKDAFT